MRSLPGAGLAGAPGRGPAASTRPRVPGAIPASGGAAVTAAGASPRRPVPPRPYRRNSCRTRPPMRRPRRHRPGRYQQQLVERARFHEFLVAACRDEPPLVQHRDPVRQPQGRAPVRDQQRGPALHDPAQGLVDLGLHPRVHRRGRVVQHQDARVGQQRAGECHPLPLAAGQGESPLTYHRVVALGKSGDELAGLGRVRRGHDLLPGRVGPPESDVPGDAVREQEAVLEDQPDRRTQRVQREVPDVVAADPDVAAAHVVEAGEQQRDRGLPRARGADQRQRLTRRHPQRQAVQHRLGRYVAEADAGELDARGARWQRDRTWPVGHHRPGVDHLEDPDDTGPRLLAQGDQGGQRPDRPDHRHQVGRERQERAERDRAPQGQPAAQRQHPDLAERGDRLQRGVVPGHQAHGPHPGAVQVGAGLFEPLHFLALLPEALHHAHAGHGGLDHLRDGSRPLLRVPARREQRAPGPERDEPQGGADGKGDESEQRREHRHDDQRAGEQHRVADEQGHPGHQALHHADVGDRPAHDLAGVQFVLPGAVQAGQRGQDLRAQIVLHVEGELAGPVTPQVQRADIGQRRADQEQCQRPDGLLGG